mmetsp:Transcript_39642/g.62979  ORF Transcript_39642/g.62979 Transcript_39642/m.62979 type:complete len:150 (-) Transcript_39642:67-516(-)
MGNLAGSCCQCEDSPTAEPVGVPTYSAFGSNFEVNHGAPAVDVPAVPNDQYAPPVLEAPQPSEVPAPVVDKGQSRPLPKGWTEQKSKSTGKTYYYNQATGESTFTFPTTEATAAKPLPPGWIEKKSRSTGKTYYWNESTKTSQFEFPKV